jgi:Mg2+ and Co2+ transporter CorA
MLNPITGALKRENDILAAQGQELSYNNQGTRNANSMLSETTSFSQAPTNYSFASQLQHSPNEADNVFNGSIKDVQQQLDNEKTQVGQDIGAVNKALGKAEEARVDNSKQVQAGKLTKEQAAKLNQDLDKYEENLTKARDQLSKLKTTLDSLKIEPKGGEQFTITSSTGASWQRDLNSEETKVISSLQSIEQMLTSDQQNFSNQGQQSQMQLQLGMTNIQQKYTIISSMNSMQHQMRMTILQNLNK